MKKVILFLISMSFSSGAWAWTYGCFYGPNVLVGGQTTLYQSASVTVNESYFFNDLHQQNTETGPETVVSPWFVTAIPYDVGIPWNELVFLGTGMPGNWLLAAQAYMDGYITLPFAPWYVPLHFPAGGYDLCQKSGYIAF